MENSACAVDQEGSPYESPPVAAESARRSRGFYVWVFLCQLLTLLWKETLERARRPWKALMEILAPAVMMLILFYAVELSPVVWIDSFNHSRLPNVTFQHNIPNESLVTTDWETDLEAVRQWRGVFSELNMTSFFLDYAVTLAELRELTDGHNRPSQVGKAWNASRIRREVARTLLSNRYAAPPFQVPTLDRYASMMEAARVAIGERGMKRMMHDDPLIQFIFYSGKLAFAVGESGNPELATAVEKLVEYLNVTTKSFASNIICQSDLVGGENSSCVFDNVSRAMSLLGTADARQGQALWALVRVDQITVQPPEFRYIIFVNEAVMQVRNTLETFAQGLGKEYANYAYNGVLSLQYELNTYFTSLAASPRARENLPLTPFVDYICSAAPTAHNATKDMFETPLNTTQRETIERAAAHGPIQTISAEPFTELNAMYAPCLYEVGAFCEHANTTELLLKCLDEVDAARTNMSPLCHSALEFVKTCPLEAKVCEYGNAYELLTAIPSSLPKCAEAISSACPNNGFLQTVQYTMLTAKCSYIIMDICSQGVKTNNINVCMMKINKLPGIIPEECRMVMDSLLGCEDEYESICPLDEAFENGMLPFACLYVNSRLFSSSCKATEFAKDILPNLFASKAVRRTVPAATYYCREVHDIYKTLVNGVVVQAFPTNGYYQRMFFLTGGPFVGLVMAIAFYFPFAAFVQSIVHERETWQKKYLILIGVHPMALLVSKLLVAFSVSLTASVFLTISVAFCIDIPNSTLYTLVYMYSLSLCALAFFIGVILPGERAAIVATPFILFLFVTPALVDGQPTELVGASMLLPPTVFAKAIAYYTQVAQLDQNHIKQSNTLQEATLILFGLLMLYLALACIVEHLSIPNSFLERLFRRCTSYVESVDTYVEQQSHRIARFYKRNELPSSSAAPVDAEEADEEGADTRNVQESNREFSIGGVSNTAKSNAVEESPSIDFQHPSEAGRESGTRLVENAQETGAPIISSAKQESGAPAQSQVSPAVPNDWYASITVRDLFHRAVGNFPMLYVPRADFYRNRLNCIIGEAVSGKSRLLETLMGACDLPQGEVRIDGKSVWSCRRNDIGVCLQKSVFWENLTVPENIRLIQLLKGHIADPAELRAEEEILISAMQLTDLRRERAGRLTTGVARKLAVAMALAGGSHTIFFDEPTASTDILSRQEIWHLLSQNARGRCIVVSTSEVEDVDVFADHITILHGGRVCLAGTPEYLRWKLRGGWVVTVCRAANTELETVLNRVHSVAPDAILVSNVGHEISFQVTERVALHTLPVMLTELRSARESGLISNITVSDTSLSESFVRLTRMLNLREAYDLHDPATEGPVAEDAYALMPSASEREIADGVLVERGMVGSSEERGTRDPKVFIRAFLALFGFRLFESLLSPHYGLIMILVPLLTFLAGTSSLDKSLNLRRIANASVLNWQLDSYPSDTFYIDLDMNGSLYQSIAERLPFMTIPGTRTTFYPLNDTFLLPTEKSSVGVDRFLAQRRLSTETFAFGAFALQGPIVDVVNSTSQPSLFPWVADVLLCNTSYPLSPLAYMELLGMIRLWAACNETSGIISASIGVLSQNDFMGKVSKNLPTRTVDIMGTLLLLLPFAFYGSRMVTALVEQRRTGFLQVLYSSSLRPAAFWIANFAYDFFTFFILVLITIFLFASNHISRGMTLGNLIAIFGVMVVFGSSTIMLSYLLSRFFKNGIAAQYFVTVFTIFTGFAFLISSCTVRFLPMNPLTRSAIELNEQFSIMMRFFPFYNLGESFMNYVLANEFNKTLDVLFRIQPAMILTLLFVCMILYETFAEVSVHVFFRDQVTSRIYTLFQKLLKIFPSSHDEGNEFSGDESFYRWKDSSRLFASEDDCVVEEREKHFPGDDIRASTLWKLCNDVYALQNVTLSLQSETLVVVGINGSGKTTLLRCLSGQMLPSHGDVYLHGHRTTRRATSKLAANGFIGYLTESLFFNRSNITPYLFLHIMADLRLLQRDANRRKHLLYLLRTLGIWPYMHRSMRTLNASVQRRVLLAAALIGYPPILLLDDATESLDPCSRRHVWAAIRSAPQGTTTVFSSKHPVDVEMIGDRVLVLDEGMMRFIGTPAQWSQKYRRGLYVSIDVSRSQEMLRLDSAVYSGAIEELKKYFSKHWPDNLLIDFRPFHYLFLIPHTAPDENATGTTASQGRTIQSVLATLIQGRGCGWELPEDREGNTDARGNQVRFPCSITISETTIERTMMNAFRETFAFKTAARGLNDRNFRISPRD
ncbi:hypothetical protein MOQ_002933 [Trypanosoma cruzi marinkellei]|uniref:ABC transporter domain-containing protein n=1 Tax=Trypanosoma cruzi marinkellei TaxID=85056 RepID=K2NE44_TRYCR|nr:hypothetical protein MOQ_002933 [Trypanosoma cruzi marinkellei]